MAAEKQPAHDLTKESWEEPKAVPQREEGGTEHGKKHAFINNERTSAGRSTSSSSSAGITPKVKTTTVRRQDSAGSDSRRNLGAAFEAAGVRQPSRS